MKKYLLTIICLGFVFAKASKAFSQEIQLETISISNGLASQQVMAIKQDRFGLLWFGTSNGLQRFDGYNWKTYRNIIGNPNSIQNNIIYDIEEDSLQNLWLGNHLGITYFDRAKNTFKNYNLDYTFQAVGIGRTIQVLQDSQGRVWAANLGMGILQFNPETDVWETAAYANINGKPAIHSSLSVFVYEDKKGGIWGGSTVYGLMHLPKGASEFSVVKFDSENTFNSGENSISEIYEDKDGIFWITSLQGVYKYDVLKNSLREIISYEVGHEDIATYLNSILEDPDGNIWILNNFRGVLKFEGNSDQYTEVLIPGNRKMNSGNWTHRFTEMIIDRSGIFWFGSYSNGLFKYDPVNQPFKYYGHDPKNPKSLSSGGTFGIFASQINPGKVFIGTRGNGLNIFNESDESVEKVNFSSSNDMFGGSARSIYEQADGTLWVGTWGDGLIKMDSSYQVLNRYKRNPDGLNQGLPNDQVRVIREDKQGNIWIGTNGGLTVLNPNTESFTQIISQHNQTYSDEILKQIKTWLENGQEIASIKQVSQSEELTQGFEITEKGSYYLVTVGEGDAASMADFGWLENSSGETIIGMETMDNSLWAGGAVKNRMLIAPMELNPGSYSLRYTSDDSHHFDSWNSPEPTFSSLYGIAIFKQDEEIESQSTIVNVNEQNSEIIIQDANITDIEIGEKYIWVASSNAGVTRIDPETNAVKYYESDPLDPTTLSNIQVYDVLEFNGQLWMATYGGINILDIDSDEINYYTEQDGLPSNFIETVLPGENGEMWFSTQNGLIQMIRSEVLDKVTFINYNEDDGIGGESFISLGAAKTPDGNFYFGGDHGITTFSMVATNKTPPSVIISNLLLSNLSVYDMGENSPLEVDLLSTDAIELKFDQNDLSFEFAALHYANPSKNQYAHMLEGLDQGWIYDNRNFAAYTNLEPGTYTFKAIASNAYGIWNEEGKRLQITILPPWWKTWWAYLIYLALVIGIILAVFAIFRRRIQLREQEKNRLKELAHAKEIEKAYADLKATQAQLIQSEKMASLGELTAGIAHEIQNPLNFVNNFSELSTELLDELNEEVEKGDLSEVKSISEDLKQNLLKINHHGRRAGLIVRGMLEHSRSSTGEKKLTNLNALVDEFLRLSYHGLRAKDKSFNSKFTIDQDSTIPKVQVAAQDIGRVILNLVNNAFYAVNEKTKTAGEDYQPEVIVSTKKTESGIEISVADNGSGIPDSIKEKIFQPFFTTKPTGSGTGLGLSLSYDIVKAHGGEIKIDSEEGKGTTFIIQLPLN